MAQQGHVPCYCIEQPRCALCRFVLSDGDSIFAGEPAHFQLFKPADLPSAHAPAEGESVWTTVAKNIGDIDEQKIKDYKEDIDSILVFVSIVRSTTPNAEILATLRLVYIPQCSQH